MSETDRSSPSFPYLPILMIITTIAGLYLWTYKPLTSSRPELNEAPEETGEFKVRARLWEDPITAVEDNQDYYKQNLQKIDTENIEIKELADLTVLFVMIDGGMYPESHENRLRTRYAVVNALGFAGYLPMDAEHLRFMGLDLETEKKPTIIPYEWYERPEKARDGNNSSSKYVLVLWAKNDDFKEGFFEKQDRLQIMLCRALKLKNCDTIFERSRLKIIGPTNSPTLEVMFGDIVSENTITEYVNTNNSNKCDRDDKVEIFSPWASLTDNLIMFDLGIENEDLKYYADKYTYPLLRKKGYELNRPIKTDYDLAKTMVKELCNRGLLDSSFCLRYTEINIDFDDESNYGDNHPMIKNKKTDSDNTRFELLCDDIYNLTKDSRKSKIVLISEWDTNYGRNLPLAFAMAFCDIVQDSINPNRGNYFNRFKLIISSERLLNSGSVFLKYSYLRGIDGKVSGGQDKLKSVINNSDDSSSGKDNNSEDERKKLEIPEGNSQLDYFRRLAQEIKEEDENLRSQCSFSERLSGNCGITAIGVLGSDVYDKLLVMHALREYFPDIQFFTTDLDSRLFHEREMDATRNLLVASDFGLELNPDIKGKAKIPPFRDNHQTATFFSTLLAVEFIKEQNGEYIINQYEGAKLILPVIHDTNPRLYEIGRYGPVDISDEEIYDQKQYNDYFECINTSNPNNCKSKHINPNIQPPRLVSKQGLPWPFYFGLIIAFALVLAPIPMKIFGWEWRNDATNNLRKVVVVMSFIIAIVYGSYQYIIENNIGRYDEPISFLSGISAWPSFIMKILVIFISIFMLILMKAQIIKNNMIIDKNFIDSDSTQDTGQAFFRSFFILGWKYSGEKNIEELWKRYKIYGKFRKRISRSLIGTAIFFIAVALVLALTGMPNHPYRLGDSLTRIYTMPIILFSVFFQFLILYFVIDATKLSRRLIHFISGNEVKWSEENCERFMTESGITIKEAEIRISIKAVVSGLYKLKFIEEHTDAIGKFIYYPFIIIFLVVLSRNRYFDDWNNPIGLIIIPLILISYTVLSSMFLRREARSARSIVLSELKKIKTGWITDEKKKSELVMIDNVIDQIQQMNRGAYSNIANNPIIHAILVPSGGLGIVTILQFLFRQ